MLSTTVAQVLHKLTLYRRVAARNKVLCLTIVCLTKHCTLSQTYHAKPWSMVVATLCCGDYSGTDCGRLVTAEGKMNAATENNPGGKPDAVNCNLKICFPARKWLVVSRIQLRVLAEFGIVYRLILTRAVNIIQAKANIRWCIRETNISF